jgi:2-methylisocitrate lyase-like PEP mutase family enzyme
VNGPCLYNAVRGGSSPAVSLADLEVSGYRIVIFPTALLGSVVAACDRALAELAAAGAATAPSQAPLATGPGDGPAALFRQVGAEEWDLLRERYGDG